MVKAVELIFAKFDIRQGIPRFVCHGRSTRSNLHRRLNREPGRTINRELNITFNKSGRGLTPIRNRHRRSAQLACMPDALLNIATLEITLCHYRVSVYHIFEHLCITVIKFI